MSLWSGRREGKSAWAPSLGVHRGRAWRREGSQGDRWALGWPGSGRESSLHPSRGNGARSLALLEPTEEQGPGTQCPQGGLPVRPELVTFRGGCLPWGQGDTCQPPPQLPPWSWHVPGADAGAEEGVAICGQRGLSSSSPRDLGRLGQRAQPRPPHPSDRRVCSVAWVRRAIESSQSLLQPIKGGGTRRSQRLCLLCLGALCWASSFLFLFLRRTYRGERDS